MSEAEYIELLWRIIVAEGSLLLLLLGALITHIIRDRDTRIELQKCKDALGIDGVRRR